MENEQIRPRQTSSENIPLDMTAKPLDEFESLNLALEVIRARFPDLTAEEQYDKALSAADSIMIIENNAATIADLRRRVDS